MLLLLLIKQRNVQIKAGMFFFLFLSDQWSARKQHIVRALKSVVLSCFIRLEKLFESAGARGKEASENENKKKLDPLRPNILLYVRFR